MDHEAQATWPEGAHPSYLLHPVTLESYRCAVRVTARGVQLSPVPAADPAGASVLGIPWRSVRGFGAEDRGAAPDGSMFQVLEIVTDQGTLTLLMAAPEVSVLMASTARFSTRWSRSRRLSHFAAPRAIFAALAVVAASVRRLVGVLRPVVVGPLAALMKVTASQRGRFAATTLGLLLMASWEALRTRLRAIAGAHRRLVGSALAGVLSITIVVVVVSSLGVDGPPAGSQENDTTTIAGNAGMSTGPMLGAHPPHRGSVSLPAATAPPEPAPPSLANAAPLQSHEIFAFAPYWTLNQSGGFDVSAMTTLAYFSVGVNPDGSLDQSDSGWAGYQSQALADLITRAHAAGSRVVLTVSCFAQSALDALTSSATAPQTLATALVAAVAAKNMDGVNLDFEGAGSGDQAGLTHLVSVVSAALKAANPHYQVTMDTYASSAGDPNGFYDIGALAPFVDAFFVMAYQLNLKASSSASSPLTSGMFSDLTTLTQYTSVVPPSKVILGIPYYGYDWPTSDGTLNATATGGATPVAYSQVVAGNHPAYWDPVTDTAWTSFQVGSQWHEQFFEDPTSLYMVAQLAQWFHVGGLGIWALGFDGNDPHMLGALLGFAPAAKTGLAGPVSTTTTTTSTSTTTTTTTPAPLPDAPTTTTAPAAPTTTTPTPTTAPPPSTTSTAPSGGGSSLIYSGTWAGQTVSLTRSSTTPSGPLYVGEMTGFQTNDPTLSCLEKDSGLSVYETSPTATQDYVIAAQPTDCATATFSFPVPGTSGSNTQSNTQSSAQTQTSDSTAATATAGSGP